MGAAVLLRLAQCISDTFFNFDHHFVIASTRRPRAKMQVYFIGIRQSKTCSEVGPIALFFYYGCTCGRHSQVAQDRAEPGEAPRPIIACGPAIQQASNPMGRLGWLRLPRPNLWGHGLQRLDRCRARSGIEIRAGRGRPCGFCRSPGPVEARGATPVAGGGRARCQSPPRLALRLGPAEARCGKLLSYKSQLPFFNLMTSPSHE
jgi:hypothetical protein